MLVVLATLAVGPLVWTATADARVRKSVVTCSPGVYQAQGKPLIAGEESPALDAIVIDGGQVGVASGCPLASAHLEPTRRGVTVRGRWSRCGDTTRKVRLAARILPGCQTMIGKITGRGRRPLERSFKAILVQPAFGADSAVQPFASELPGLGGITPRPLASVVDAEGNQADFVADELVLESDDPAALEAFVTRWHGQVLATIIPADFGLPDLKSRHLVRIDPSAADPASLAGDLHALEPLSRGDHRVSSDRALRLLAAAAREAAAGSPIGVNWVARGAGFEEKVATEAPTGPAGYDPNSFTWPYMRRGGSQDIGVGDAWRALAFSGSLGNKVKVAVLDAGFEPNADFPSGWSALSVFPGKSATGSTNLESDKPWHGTQVVVAGMGVPDNAFGAAGPGGPVTSLLTIYTSGDFFVAGHAVLAAVAANAKIINMSFGVRVPASLSWSVLPFDGITAGARAAGHLLFAAAGNDGADVDAEDCLPYVGVCWEKAWHTPCENHGVACVGGIANGSRLRHSGSNYGGKDVPIFAPYSVYLGADPEHPGNQTIVGSGTSFSSPFTAGVAALVWAAKPTLDAGGVWDTLVRTANGSSDGSVPRVVNAYAAVKDAIGRNVPPTVRIVSPADGTHLGYGGLTPTALEAAPADLEDDTTCCAVTWTSDVDGAIGSGRTLGYIFASPGTRVITATATDSAGASTSASVTVTAENGAPTVDITLPVDGGPYHRGIPIAFEGRSADPNEISLPCSALEWDSDNMLDNFTFGGDFPISGKCSPTITFHSTGSRTITLTGTDERGVAAIDSLRVSIVDPPPTGPPLVTILRPSNGASVLGNTTISLEGSATDPDGTATLFSVWTLKLEGEVGDGSMIGIGSTVNWRPADSISHSQSVQVCLTATGDPDGNTTTCVTIDVTILH